MSKEVQFEDIPKQELLGIINSIPGFDPVDKVQITSHGGVTSILFKNTLEEIKVQDARWELLEKLAQNHLEKSKYIGMGRDDEYNEIGNCSMRPFRSISEAISYGETLIMKDSRGHRYYDSYIIQPLLKGINSFVLNDEEIKFIDAIEQKQNNSDMSPS